MIPPFYELRICSCLIPFKEIPNAVPERGCSLDDVVCCLSKELYRFREPFACHIANAINEKLGLPADILEEIKAAAFSRPLGLHLFEFNF